MGKIGREELHSVLMHLDFTIFWNMLTVASELSTPSGRGPCHGLESFRFFPVSSWGNTPEPSPHTFSPIYRTVPCISIEHLVCALLPAYELRTTIAPITHASVSCMGEGGSKAALVGALQSNPNRRKLGFSPVASCGVFLYAHKIPGKYLSHCTLHACEGSSSACD